MSRVALGQIHGAFGIQGWVRVESYTRPPEAILDYGYWELGTRRYKVLDGQLQGRGVVARLKGVLDRAAAEALRGQSIEVDRAAMPEANPGEYYWMDLVGCAVRNPAGAELGQVESLFSNGAQDVMVIRGERERLVPFVPAIVQSVDLAHKRIVVDWELDY